MSLSVSKILYFAGLSIFVSMSLCVYDPVFCKSGCLCVYESVCLGVCASVSLCATVCVSACLRVYVSVCLCVCTSV